MMTDLSFLGDGEIKPCARFRAHRSHSVYAAGADPSQDCKACRGMSFEDTRLRDCAKKARRFCFLASVVKNDSHGLPVTGAQSANAMTHIHPIAAARSLDGAMMHSERDPVALP